MDDFAAIDFETANQYRSSVCSVGVVTVRNGQLKDKFYSLVYPRPDFFIPWTTRIHGLTMLDVEDAPPFPDVWASIAPLIEGLPLWPTTALSTKDACVPYSANTIWNIPDIRSTAPAVPHAGVWDISCPIISCIRWPHTAATTSPTIIMPWPTPKHVPPSQ